MTEKEAAAVEMGQEEEEAASLPGATDYNPWDDEKLILEVFEEEDCTFYRADPRIKQLFPGEADMPNAAAVYGRCSARLKALPNIVLAALERARKSAFSVRSSTKFLVERLVSLFPSCILDNEEVMLGIVGVDGEFLKFCSDRLRDTCSVVKKAIAIDSWGARYASDRLKDNEESAGELCDKKADFLKHCSARLRNDREFVKKRLANDLKCYNHAGEELKKDTEFWFEMLDVYPDLFEFLDRSEYRVFDVVKKMVAKDRKYARHGTRYWQATGIPLVKKLTEDWHSLFPYLNTTLRDNDDFVAEVLERDLEMIKYASNRIQLLLRNGLWENDAAKRFPPCLPRKRRVAEMMYAVPGMYKLLGKQAKERNPDAATLALVGSLEECDELDERMEILKACPESVTDHILFDFGDNSLPALDVRFDSCGFPGAPKKWHPKWS